MKLARVAPVVLSVVCLLFSICTGRRTQLEFVPDLVHHEPTTGRVLLQRVIDDSGSQLKSSETQKAATADGLPTVGEGQPCGAEVGICGGNLCCSMGGVCGIGIDFCGYGCRDNFGKCFIVDTGAKASTPGVNANTGSSTSQSKKKDARSTALIAIIIGACLGLVLVSIVGLLLLRRRRQTADDSNNKAIEAGPEAYRNGSAEDPPGDDTKLLDKDQACCISFFCGVDGGEQHQIATGEVANGGEGEAVSMQNVVAPPPGLVLPVQGTGMESIPFGMFSPTSSAGLLSPGAQALNSAALSGALVSPMYAAQTGLMSPSGVFSPVKAAAVAGWDTDSTVARAPAGGGQRRNLFAEAMAHLDGLEGGLAAVTSQASSQGAVLVNQSVDSTAAATDSTFARAPELPTRTSKGNESEDDTVVKYVHVIKETTPGLASIKTGSTATDNPLHSSAFCPACSYGSCNVHVPNRNSDDGAPKQARPRSAHGSASGSDAENPTSELGASFELMQRGNANIVSDRPMAPSTPKRPSTRSYTSQNDTDSEKETYVWSAETTPLSITIIPSRSKSPSSKTPKSSHSGRSPHPPRSPHHGKSKSPYAPRSPHHSYSHHRPKSPGNTYTHQPKSPALHSQQPHSPHYTNYAPPSRQPHQMSPPRRHQSSRSRSPSARSTRSRSPSPARSMVSARSHSPAPSSSSRSSSPMVRSNPTYRTGPPGMGPQGLSSRGRDPRIDRSPFSRDPRDVGDNREFARGELRGDHGKDSAEHYAKQRRIQTTPPKRSGMALKDRRRGIVLGADDHGDDLGFFMPNPAGGGASGVRM